MTASIHQPNYLPWMGLIDKIANADVFIFLDDAQYSNTGHNKNIIKGPNGNLTLSVPVKQHLGDQINEVQTRDELPWKKKHLKSIEMCYKRAPYYDEVYPLMKELIDRDYDTIAQLNMAILLEWAKRFQLKTTIRVSSEFEIQTAKEEKVIDLCLAVGADTYLSGNGARSYQVEDHFIAQGLKLTYQSYAPIVYPQLWGNFEQNLSALDYIMNCGFTYPQNHMKFAGSHA